MGKITRTFTGRNFFSLRRWFINKISEIPAGLSYFVLANNWIVCVKAMILGSREHEKCCAKSMVPCAICTQLPPRLLCSLLSPFRQFSWPDRQPESQTRLLWSILLTMSRRRLRYAAFFLLWDSIPHSLVDWRSWGDYKNMYRATKVL